MSNSLKNTFQGLKIIIAQYLPEVSWHCDHVIHPAWMLFWNPEPGARIICGDQEYSADRQYAYLIPPNTTISGYSDRKFPHLYTHFETSDAFDNIKKTIYQLPPGPAEKFFKEHLSSDILRRQLYWQIMILEYLAMLPDDAWGSNTESPTDQRIVKALNFAMNNNYCADWNNAFLAKQAGMSESNFYRRFREVMKISPTRYFLSMRLNRARELLTTTNQGISQIAEQCGFADRYCFSKAFKSFFGISPGAFRQAGTVRQTPTGDLQNASSTVDKKNSKIL